MTKPKFKKGDKVEIRFLGMWVKAQIVGGPVKNIHYKEDGTRVEQAGYFYSKAGRSKWSGWSITSKIRKVE